MEEGKEEEEEVKERENSNHFGKMCRPIIVRCSPEHLLGHQTGCILWRSAYTFHILSR